MQTCGQGQYDEIALLIFSYIFSLELPASWAIAIAISLRIIVAVAVRRKQCGNKLVTVFQCNLEYALRHHLSNTLRYLPPAETI
jgi:hypothetical protein